MTAFAEMKPALLTRLQPSSTNPPLIKVLFPLLQVALISSLLAVLLAPSAWTQGLYFSLLLAWQLGLSCRLARQVWRPHLRICSTQAALSVVAAVWHAGLSWLLGVPGGAALMGLTLVTLGLYGWLCHERG